LKYSICPKGLVNGLSPIKDLKFIVFFVPSLNVKRISKLSVSSAFNICANRSGRLK
jgi:hypothetical protein